MSKIIKSKKENLLDLKECNKFLSQLDIKYKNWKNNCGKNF